MPDIQHIQGLGALQEFFKQFPADVGKKVLRKGAGAGAQVVKAFVGPRVPLGKSTKRHVAGTMKRALRVVFRREKSNEGQAVFAVTFRKGKGAQGKLNRKGTVFTLPTDAYYAYWVDQGHRIVGRRAKAGKFLGHATKRSRRALADATGARVEGVDFFLPAFTASREAAQDAMIAAMQAEVKSLT